MKSLNMGIIFPQTEFGSDPVTIRDYAQTAEALGFTHIALNQDFHTRGRRIEEQVPVLRQLWTQPLVTFSGQWHTIPDAGLNSLPVQQPIPIWLWISHIQAWQAAGATHFSLNPLGLGFDTSAHLAALRTFAEAVNLA